MCEFYDHDTFVAREKEVQDALNAGTPRAELIEKLEAEEATAREGGDITAMWMVEDLQILAMTTEITKVPVTA
jgi:hypothetical protein